MRRDRLTIAVDFDGVIAEFWGWVGEFTFGDTLIPDSVTHTVTTRDFLKKLSEDYRVVIFTARPDIAEVWKWLNARGLSNFVDEVTNTKPPAFAYIDDRNIAFNGSYGDTLNELKHFKPYWKGDE